MVHGLGVVSAVFLPIATPWRVFRLPVVVDSRLGATGGPVVRQILYPIGVWVVTLLRSVSRVQVWLVVLRVGATGALLLVSTRLPWRRGVRATGRLRQLTSDRRVPWAIPTRKATIVLVLVVRPVYSVILVVGPTWPSLNAIVRPGRTSVDGVASTTASLVKLLLEDPTLLLKVLRRDHG